MAIAENSVYFQSMTVLLKFMWKGICTFFYACINMKHNLKQDTDWPNHNYTGLAIDVQISISRSDSQVTRTWIPLLGTPAFVS